MRLTMKERRAMTVTKATAAQHWRSSKKRKKILDQIVEARGYELSYGASRRGRSWRRAGGAKEEPKCPDNTTNVTLV